MDLNVITEDIANFLKEFDSINPVHKSFQPGIGPFGEPQLIRELSQGLRSKGYECVTRRTPDLDINAGQWAVEFKIVRPYGDNGREAENWSVNMLHPYQGNTSAIGDAMKLRNLSEYQQRAVFIIGYEHDPAKIPLEPLIRSFEVIATEVIGITLGPRIEESRGNLVHPEHQIVRCYAWEIL